MKNKEIEELLKSDLANSAPDDFSIVKGRVTPRELKSQKTVLQPAYATSNGGNHTVGNKSLWKRILAIGLAFLAVITSTFFVLLQLFSSGEKISDGYFVIDVNPSVELYYDDTGKVTKTEGLNRDGEVLLSSTSLIGKSYEEALKTLFNRCVQLGYFHPDRDNNALLVSANKNEGGLDATLTKKAKDTLTTLFADKGFQGVVLTGMEETESLADAASEFGIDAQKYALILAATAMGAEIKEEEYSTLSVKEVYVRIEEKRKEEDTSNRLLIYQQLLTEVETLLEELEIELNALIVKLEDLLQGTLDETTSQRYVRYVEKLQNYVSSIQEIDTAVGKQLLMQRISAYLDEMRHEEFSIQNNQEIGNLLHQVYGKVELSMENVCEKNAKLDYFDATMEEMKAARQDKFLDNLLPGVSEFDFEQEWSAAMDGIQDNFYVSWYAIKKQWKEYRISDLH